MKENTNKDHWLHLRLSAAEHELISRNFRATTCRKLSEFARNKLLEKPNTTLYRNQSMDDFMAELMRLRSDLNAIGNNFNQSVKKLHTLVHMPELSAWIKGYESEREAMQNKVASINLSIQKFAEQWLQSSKQDHQ